MDHARAEIIVDIPSVAITNKRSIKSLIEKEEHRWQCRASSIVFPILWSGGTTLKNDVYFIESAQRPGLSLNDVIDQCTHEGWKIWLDIPLDLKAVRTDLVHIKDFYGTSSIHACINSPATMRALELIVNEVIKVTGPTGSGPLAGIVFSIQNLWPMAGIDHADLSCFCQYCRASLHEANPSLSLSSFKGIPNPWDLALKVTSTGIDHVNAFSSKSPPEDLLEMSQAGGYYGAEALREGKDQEATRQQLLHWADLVLQYCHAKHHLTVTALAAIVSLLKSAFGHDTNVAGITSTFSYDWLGGMFFDLLDHSCPLDELWIDPSNDSNVLANLPYRYYLWERARYYPANFLEAVELTSDFTQTELQAADPRAHRHLRFLAQRCLMRQPTAPLTIQLLPQAVPSNERPPVVLPLDRQIVADLVEEFSPQAQMDAEADVSNRLLEIARSFISRSPEE